MKNTSESPEQLMSCHGNSTYVVMFELCTSLMRSPGNNDITVLLRPGTTEEVVWVSLLCLWFELSGPPYSNS